MALDKENYVWHETGDDGTRFAVGVLSSDDGICGLYLSVISPIHGQASVVLSLDTAQAWSRGLTAVLPLALLDMEVEEHLRKM